MEQRGSVDFEVDDRFDLGRCIGEGGMGVVYEAVDRERQTRVALKRLRSLDPHSIFRFKKEFRALAGIVHPNLVTLYEMFSAGDHWFFTMEYIDGVDFLTYVRGGDDPGQAALEASTVTALTVGTSTAGESAETLERPLARVESSDLEPRYRRLRSAMRQLATGINALHGAGYLHCDIKPSNVLVTAEERVVLLDFGVIKGLGQEDSADEIGGTPSYMAPELGSAEAEATEASDWYAVGLILFEALTGWQPFRGRLREVMELKRMVQVPEPRAIQPAVPADLNALCRDMLSINPALRPSGESVLDRIASQQQRALPCAIYRAPGQERDEQKRFLGRERHLEALNEAFGATRAGRGVVVKVTGRSGIGKSALTWFFLNQLIEQGDVLVLSGRCHEWESLPFKAVDSVIDALVRYLLQLPSGELRGLLPRDVGLLARLFPVLRRVQAVASSPDEPSPPPPLELRRRAFAALRELMGCLCERVSVVMFIDDLQWGDVDSAPLLAELMRPPDVPPMLCILSYRREETPPHALPEQIGRPGAAGRTEINIKELEVGPLTHEEVSDLTRALLEEAGHDTSRCEAIAKESQGNPFFVHELVRYVTTSAERPAKRPLTLDQALRARVERLPPAPRRMLEVVAIAGRPMAQGLIKKAAKLGDEGQQAMAMLRTERMLRAVGAREEDLIETSHDRIRESVVAKLDRADLEDLHFRLARVLEATERPDHEALVSHFLGAGLKDRAGKYAVLAARQASGALAFQRAADLYRVALEHGDHDRTVRHALRAELGEALANAGRCVDAARAFLDAAEGADPAGAVEMRRRAAEMYLVSGYEREGLATLAAVLEQIGMRPATTARRAMLSIVARRLWLKMRGLGYKPREVSDLREGVSTRIDIFWSATVGLSFLNPILAFEYQTRHLLLSLNAGDLHRIGRAMATDVAYSMMAGASEASIQRLLSESASIARRTGDPYLHGLCYVSRGLGEYIKGRWREGLRLADIATGLLRGHGAGLDWEMITASTAAIWSLWSMGAIREMNRRLTPLIAAADARGDLLTRLNLSITLGLGRMLETSRLEDAQHGLQELTRILPQKGYGLSHRLALHFRVMLALYSGEGEEAWRAVSGDWPSIKRSGLLRVPVNRANCYFMQALSALAAAADRADSGALVRVAGRASRRLLRDGQQYTDGYASLIRAVIARLERDDEAALAHLDRAERDFAGSDMALHAAVALRRRGELVGGEEGRQQVESADQRLVRLGVGDPARTARMLTPWPSTG